MPKSQSLYLFRATGDWSEIARSSSTTSDIDKTEVVYVFVAGDAAKQPTHLVVFDSWTHFTAGLSVTSVAR